LGFLEPIAFRRKGPRLWGLDFLGFPWILSSESRLFNGLLGMKQEGIFLALSPWRERPRNGVVWPMRKAGLIMAESVPWLLVFRKRLSALIALAVDLVQYRIGIED
jgi:hypothetical protein